MQHAARPPIFIGGAGRSGTKLVRAILNAHPHLVASHELKVTPILAKAWQEVRAFGPHLHQHFDASPRDIDALFARTIECFLRRVSERHNGARVIEKTPNNALVFGHLSHLFPDSPLIHIIRDGRDVVRSMLKKTWKQPDGTPHPISQDPATAAAYWRDVVRAGREAARSERVRTNYIEIRYEDLVTAPLPVMRSLVDHVDEPWDDGVAEFHKHEDPLYPHVQRPISSASVGTWQHDLDAAAKNAIKQEAGDLLVELGYAADSNW